MDFLDIVPHPPDRNQSALLAVVLWGPPAAPPPYTVKKVDEKLQPAWPDVTDSLVRGMENFFDMEIELIRRVPTMKTEYLEIREIFLQLIWRVSTIKTEYFEIGWIFRRFFDITRRSFPTIFRQ